MKPFLVALVRTLRHSIPLLVGSLLVQVPTAQQFRLGKILSGQTLSARSVFAADLDGDGDRDVLSASAFDDKIAWY